MSLSLLIVLATPSFSQVVKTNLYRKPQEIHTEAAVAPKTKPTARAKPEAEAAGNLPQEYRGALAGFHASENPIVLPTTPQRVIYSPLPFGEVFEAEIPESLIAFPDVKVPVRALIKTRSQSGGVFLGEASLEKNSKRIVVEFKKFRPAKGVQTFKVLASAMDDQGTLGLAGSYHSGEAKYFTAELLAALASGYADASVERTTTPFGQTQEPNTTANAGRKAVSSALSRTADRFAEKVRAASEYSTLEGPVKVRVLIQDQPVEEGIK